MKVRLEKRNELKIVKVECLYIRFKMKPNCDLFFSYFTKLHQFKTSIIFHNYLHHVCNRRIDISRRRTVISEK